MCQTVYYGCYASVAKLPNAFLFDGRATPGYSPRRDALTHLTLASSNIAFERQHVIIAGWYDTTNTQSPDHVGSAPEWHADRR